MEITSVDGGLLSSWTVAESSALRLLSQAQGADSWRFWATRGEDKVAMLAPVFITDMLIRIDGVPLSLSSLRSVSELAYGQHTLSGSGELSRRKSSGWQL
jgi:hypothetical protein